MEPIYEELKRLTDLLGDYIAKYDFEEEDIDELNDCIETINDYLGGPEVEEDVEQMVEE